jgi:hypothetical protein
MPWTLVIIFGTAQQQFQLPARRRFEPVADQRLILSIDYRASVLRLPVEH